MSASLLYLIITLNLQYLSNLWLHKLIRSTTRLNFIITFVCREFYLSPKDESLSMIDDTLIATMNPRHPRCPSCEKRVCARTYNTRFLWILSHETSVAIRAARNNGEKGRKRPVTRTETQSLVARR